MANFRKKKETPRSPRRSASSPANRKRHPNAGHRAYLRVLRRGRFQRLAQLSGFSLLLLQAGAGALDPRDRSLLGFLQPPFHLPQPLSKVPRLRLRLVQLLPQLVGLGRRRLRRRPPLFLLLRPGLRCRNGGVPLGFELPCLRLRFLQLRQGGEGEGVRGW